jgi:hypothetical protein
VGAKLGELPVTIVTGLPRSGTSMMMQMLAAGGMPVLTDNARAPDADNPRGYLEFEPAKRTARDARWIAGAAGKAVKLVHVLLPDLPPGCEYRVLFMHRDIGEVLASQRAMLDRLQRSGADMTPARLAEAFSKQLKRSRDWIARQAHVFVLDVHYRRVIESPATEAQRINEFLGGALDEANMAAAVDPILYRQRAAQ